MIVRVHGAALLPPCARRPKAVAALCRKALGTRRDDPGVLTVVFLGRREHRALNRRFLGHDYDTDVIAFPYDPPRRPDDPFGDVFVSARKVRSQAATLGHSPLTEALTLALHGTLHLLGYDDKTARGRARMFRRQDELLNETRLQGRRRR